VRGLFADLCRDFDQVAAGRFHFELNVGSLDRRFHQDEGFARALAHRKQAAQRAVHAQRLVDAGALVEILGDAFVIVIADAIVKTHRRLRYYPQSMLRSGERMPLPEVSSSADIAESNRNIRFVRISIGSVSAK
jgi:hypothetical protein